MNLLPRSSLACAARRVALACALANGADAVTVTTTFDNLSANNNANNGIGSLYQSGDFRFSSGNLFYRGQRNVYYPGSGALYTAGSDPMTITRVDGQAFNFYAADLAEREGVGETAGFTGTRADGSKVTASVRLDGNSPASQTFGFAGFTNIVSLQFSGGDQLDKAIFSNLVPPPPSDATVHFDAATPGNAGAAYGENGYVMTTTAAGGLAIQSTMNDSPGLGVAGAGTIDLTGTGPWFSLKGFDIQGGAGITGLFRLIVTSEDGLIHTSSNFTYGSYGESDLRQLFGGQAYADQITNARFENTSGQGVVLDNIQAIPEAATPVFASAAFFLALRRRRSLEPAAASPLPNQQPHLIPSP